MKRIIQAALAVAGFVGVIAASIFFLPLKGPWVDRWVSEELTRAAGMRIDVYGARIFRWRRVDFNLASLTGAEQNLLAASGVGSIEFDGLDGFRHDFSKARVKLRDVALMQELMQRPKFIAWASKDAIVEPVYVPEAIAVIKRNPPATQIQLLRFVSARLSLLGGARFERRRLSKLHAVVFLPKDMFENVPKELRARMIRRADGWHGVRVAYSSGSLTASGSSGPFFTARWQNETPELK